MNPLPASLVLLVLLKAEDTLCVEYFGLELYGSFNSRICDNGSLWRIVIYENLDVEPPFGSRAEGMQAARHSCTSSALTTLFAGTLEFNVYLKLFSRISELSIEVAGEDGSIISSYRRGKFCNGLRKGWEMVHVKLNSTMKGLINIRGRSLNDEIILLDSIRYIPDGAITNEPEKIKRSINNVRANGSEVLIDYEEVKNRNQDVASDSFWNTTTIILVAILGVLVIALIVTCMYCCYKIKPRDNTIPKDFLEDAEPPTTITIPRITEVYYMSPGFVTFDNRF